MRRAPRLLPVHRHTSGHQGQVQDHQQGLLLQVQRQDSEANAGTCPGELCQETIIPKVRGRGIIIFIITKNLILRHVRSVHGSSSNIGSVSAQPILPGVDNDLGESFFSLVTEVNL